VKDIQSRLTILNFDGAAYTDVSDALCDFGTDTEDITLASAGYLYLGFPKPITGTFFYLETENTTPLTVTAQVYAQSGWVTPSSLDDTKGFTRSGFISWELPETGVVASTVNGMEMLWHRLAVSTDSEEMTVIAVSALFADDNELVKEFPDILDTSFLLGKPNHILIHESCRDEIVQRFRNQGLRTVRNSYYRRLTHWDIMDVQEVRMAARYLALSKIFENVANYDDKDNWRQKSRMYWNKFEKAVDLAFLTWDRLQDGSINMQRDISVGVLSR
jgi:hypothetical protein